MNFKKHKSVFQLMSAIFLIALGSGLLVAGFIVHPPGEIHNSVLIAFGEILTFAGALFGIAYHYQHRPYDHRISNKHSEYRDHDHEEDK